MATFDPNAAINVNWRPEFQCILDVVELRWRSTGRDIDLVIRCTVELLRDGINPTAHTIIDAIYGSDTPPQSGAGFNRSKWFAYVPDVVAHLRSEFPLGVLRL